MIYQKPLSLRPRTHGDFERKQAPCASNWAPFSSSCCCSIGAGECARHPGTGSGICLKMFFLQAGSYVLPRRNENKAPRVHGVHWEPHCLEEVRVWSLCRALRMRQVRPSRALSSEQLMCPPPAPGGCSCPSLSQVTSMLSGAGCPGLFL